MSVKKQIPSLCKLCSLYEEKPEDFLDETGIDSFLTTIFLTSPSPIEIYVLAKVPTGSILHSSCSTFCNLKPQQRYILQDEVIISKIKPSSLSDTLRDLLESIDKASMCLQIPLTKFKIEIESTKSKNNFFITLTISLNIQRNKFVHRSSFETIFLASFLSETFNYTSINIFQQKLSTLTIGKFTFSTRTNITSQTNVKELRAIAMCSAFTPDWGYEISTINLIGGVFCPNTKCLGNFCLHKETFQSLGRSDCQCPPLASVCPVCSIPFED